MAKPDNRMIYAIDVGVVLQALVLGVMAWVGYNINNMTKDIASLNASSKVNIVQIQRNASDIVVLRNDVNRIDNEQSKRTPAIKLIYTHERQHHRGSK